MSDAQRSCSPLLDQSPSGDPLFSSQLLPVYILNMMFYDMEYLFSQFESAVLTMHPATLLWTWCWQSMRNWKIHNLGQASLSNNYNMSLLYQH